MQRQQVGAAVQLQALMRGHLVRAEAALVAKLQQQQLDAATQLQSLMRGHLGRAEAARAAQLQQQRGEALAIRRELRVEKGEVQKAEELLLQLAVGALSGAW